MRNPLIKRIPKELASDWHKYLVIILFMVIMIGVISGMYVGHDSMLASVAEGRVELKLEDGSFELSDKASPELIEAISTGEMADVRQYFIDEGMKEAKEEVDKAAEEALNEQVTAAIEAQVRAGCEEYGITDEDMIQAQIDAAMEEGFEDALEEARESDEYKDALAEAYDEAYDEVVKAVDEEWDDIAEEYKLNEEGFVPVPVTLYENFYRDEEEDYDNDGTSDATVRVFSSAKEVDLASFLEGEAPDADDEIVIDRMHADNTGVKVGDTITVGGKEFKVVGL
ncbi:MAG: permease, partial [Clostridiales bacterium]|nr:permease [Clostridiales bacterium]